MNDEEKQSLELYRLKTWDDQLQAALTEMTELQQNMQALSSRALGLNDIVCMAALEMAEQREKLKSLGLNDEEIDRVAKKPDLPIIVGQILKRAKGD